MLKKLFFLAALLTATVMNLQAEVVVTSWTIAGDQAMMGSKWNQADTNNDMKVFGGSYQLKKFAYLTEGEYEYKACANHAWGIKEIPSSVNQTLKIEDDGDYIVTFTLDMAGTTLSAKAELNTYSGPFVDTYVNDKSMGSVTGGGVYKKNDQVTLTAVPNAGYKFVNWSGDQTSTTNPLSFTASAVYTAVQANFEAETPAGPDMHDFLYFVGLNGNDTVHLDKMRTETPSTFEYSMDRKTWTAYDTWTTVSQTRKKGNPIALNQGDTVFFRAKGVNGKNATVGTNNAYFTFFFGKDDSIAVGGNIMSLYDASCEQDTMTESGFYWLFYQNKNLVSAADLKLPAKKLAKNCYESMFDYCTALTDAPTISAETAAKYSCYYMFRGCTSLTTAPALPATKMAENCYQQMFYGCTALTQVPEMKADSLAKLCYYGMFSGCTSLQVDTCADGSCDGVKFEPTTVGDEPASWSAQMFTGCKGTITRPQLNGHYCVKEYIEPAKIVVVYDLQGHGEAIKNDTIVTGNKLTEPAKPTAQGYEFRDWYTDAQSMGEKFNFYKAITATKDSTITLYAKWRDPVVWKQFQDSLNTYSYVEYDSTYGAGFIIHLATTQDAQVQPLEDAAFIEASEEVLANYDFRTYTTTIVSLYPAMNDELFKCASVESPSTLIAAYTQLPYRVNGLNAVSELYSSYVDLVYKAWAETNYENDADICKCMFNSDVFFKGTAKLLEALIASEK